MFRQHAGEDLVAQLEFMAAGIHGARGQRHARPHRADEQEQIGKALARLNMRMGVFVAHTDRLGRADPDDRPTRPSATLLKEVRESVEVAKRVNAKWMTVVPGSRGRRPTSTTRPPRRRDAQRACAISSRTGW